MILLLILLTSISSAKPLSGLGFQVGLADPKWLFTVQIYYHEKFKCTGSAITDYFVLTAGHCLTNAAWETWQTIVVQDPYLRKPFSIEKISERFKHLAIRISIHHKIEKENLKHDLGLIKVMKRLPHKMDLHHEWVDLKLGSICEYAGYGEWMDGPLIIQLQKMNTSVRDIYDTKIFTLDSVGHTVAVTVNAAMVIPIANSISVFNLREILDHHSCARFQMEMDNII